MPPRKFTPADAANAMWKGLALDSMVRGASIPKAQATRNEQLQARGRFRQAAAYLKQAGLSQDERDKVMKPHQLAYDPKHRTRH